jgi:hypothetical protein
MQIDVRDCDTAIINLAHQVERRSRMDALCARLGLRYRFVHGIRAEIGFYGCGLSHIRALRSAASTPFLLLEDDVTADPDFDPIIEAPDDADAVYLGASTYGALPAFGNVGYAGLVAAERCPGGLLRVHNMLGAHAILYLNEDFRRAAAEAMLAAMADRGQPPDCGLADIQSDFRVYALETPRLYQAPDIQASAEYGHMQERSTRVVKCLAPGAAVATQVEGVSRKLRLDWAGSRLEWRVFE